ncbi:hypothetical protein [Virgibacillus ndiopensis]|uniref:hypothetical protein n=1 Tax=Virgibacillus ndiopensis TaxID=2004408 RepID=UPI000C06C1F7|nr:hypothetical protein [Virgibacillus ndiopensis]
MGDKNLFKQLLGKQLRLKRIENIGRIERGEKLPTTFTLVILCKSLNIKIDPLIEEVWIKMKLESNE